MQVLIDLSEKTFGITFVYCVDTRDFEMVVVERESDEWFQTNYGMVEQKWHARVGANPASFNRSIKVWVP